MEKKYKLQRPTGQEQTVRVTACRAKTGENPFVVSGDFEPSPPGPPRKRHNRMIALLSVGLVMAFLLSLKIGRVPISLEDLSHILFSWTTGQPLEAALEGKGMVFLLVRLPRSLLALLMGMGLSVSGAVYQGLFRNPLVSPDILGVSAGATFGAALALILPGTSFALIHVLAFSFGLAAVSLALGLSRLVAVRPLLMLVLAGIVVSSLFNSAITLMKYLADPYNELPAIVFWIMGSVSRAEWRDLQTAFPLVGLCIVIISLMRYRLNVLSLGDLQTKAIGLNPALYRTLFIALSSVLVAVSVSTCGQIGWIGLVIPHIARTLTGPNHEVMIPVTVLVGGIFMVLADTLARTLTMAELPISVITSFIGAPLFAYLLYQNRGSGWS